MDRKELEVTCPCCASRLVIDLRTERVVRSARPEERDEQGKPKVAESDWTSAMEKVEGRTRSSEDKLNAALDRERNRQSRLDELFRSAKERLGEGEPES
jgi:hypothetical protein